MKRLFTLLVVVLALCAGGAAVVLPVPRTDQQTEELKPDPKPQNAKEPPTEWIDPNTGHRVFRLSKEPGSSNLYFHQNAYSADGRKLVITTPGGLAAVDLKTRGIEKIVDSRSVIVIGRKTGQVYYNKGGAIFATDLNTKETREVVKLPAGYRAVSTLNADETLLAGTVGATDPTGMTPRPEPQKLPPQRERMFPGKEKLTPEEEASVAKEERLAGRLANPDSMAIFTLNTKTGEVKTFGYSYAWLNHVQFSPTDPKLLMFCHEGTWHEVERIWTIRTDGTSMKLMHERKMDMEIAGHEFWNPDGKIIWYDLQTPRSKQFWLAGVNVATGEKTRYQLERDQWSVHYNVSPDGKLFAGDGGDAGQVAFAKDGKWIYLFRPAKEVLAAERLVNMAKHDYKLEPNVTFSPDGKWVVFRSNMHGPTHVYAVEVKKANSEDAPKPKIEPKPETPKTALKFSFAPGKAEPGYPQVPADTAYTKECGYGFDLGSKVEAIDRGGDDAIRSGFCTSAKPFFFSVALPEGNYNVTVTLGDLKGESTTTVKAETRRLMLEKVQTATGKFETRTFTVNIRTPKITGGGQVKLKDREQGVLHWDDKLTLEFNNTRPCLCALEIVKVENAVTVYIVGDSTVTDQPKEPWNSWGQMLPRFFKPGVAIANHAESGESLKSSRGAKRLDKVLSTMKEGDYLFIQFGHNDMKERGEGVGAFTTYKASLKEYVTEARKHGGIPVLVTPMHRKSLDGSGKITNTLGDYPEAVRQAAKEEEVSLIDLNAMSKILYEALGPKDIGKAFQDGTHHNNYGSFELARCVVEGIKQNKLDLAKLLADDVQPFDPSKPDSVDDFKVPASPQSTTGKPDGN